MDDSKNLSRIYQWEWVRLRRRPLPSNKSSKALGCVFSLSQLITTITIQGSIYMVKKIDCMDTKVPNLGINLKLAQPRVLGELSRT